MRTIVALLLLLAGCASSPPKPSSLTASELESRMLQTEGVERQDVDEPRGWYWLLTTLNGLLEATGESENEFRMENGHVYPVRLLGVESPDALTHSKEEPTGLDWEGDKVVLTFEFEIDDRSLYQRARFLSWGPAVLSGDDEPAMLSQAAPYRAQVKTLSLWARRFNTAGQARVAWWGELENTRTQERTMMRVRLFDQTSPEWPAIQRARAHAGSHDEPNRAMRAGAAAVHELGLSVD